MQEVLSAKIYCRQEYSATQQQGLYSTDMLDLPPGDHYPDESISSSDSLFCVSIYLATPQIVDLSQFRDTTYRAEAHRVGDVIGRGVVGSRNVPQRKGQMGSDNTIKQNRCDDLTTEKYES